MGLRTATIGVLGSAVVLMAGSVGAATPALGASCPGPSFSGGKETLTFCYTGSQQTWKVPSGVNSVTFDLFGAQGGTGGAGGAGGKGAEVTKTMTVTPGSTVYIYIGGRGTDGLASGGTLPVAGGFNGGGTGGGSGSSSSGAGGGASDIRTDGFALTDRKLVAGGGGGGGDSNGVGGVGGDTTGGDGAGCGGEVNNNARGGTQSAGGAAGTGGTTPATPGALGVGGDGATDTQQDSGGGGGGGGYYGGGGATSYCGGAGGSSLDPPGVIMTPGVRAGAGLMTVTFAAAALPPTSGPAPSIPWVPLAGLAIGLALLGVGLRGRRTA